MFSLENLILGVIISTPIAIFALKKKHLTKGGVIVAKDGVTIQRIYGKTYWAHRDGVKLSEKRMTEMERYYSLDTNNLKIPKELFRSPQGVEY